MLVIKSDGSKWIVDDNGERPYQWYHGAKDWFLNRWYGRDWRKRQRVFKKAGTRYYGDGGTIHHSTYVDVEVHNGRVVSIWFRCQTLPFKQHPVDDQRAGEMDRLYEGFHSELHGVEIKDD
jgi:hypothetical protein